MKVQFTYYGDPVVLDDDGTVKCDDAQQRSIWRRALATGSVQQSIAHDIARELKRNGYIDDFTVEHDDEPIEY